MPDERDRRFQWEPGDITYTPSRCKDCGDTLDERKDHQDEHPELCCDCFDLALGMPLEQLNAERAAKGKPPLTAKASR